MVADKPLTDLASTLYAEWVSASVKLSVAGFAAAAKIADATTNALVSAKQKTEQAAAKNQPETSVKPSASNASPANSAATPTIVVSIPVAAKTIAQHDDLKQITGVGPKLVQMLARKGITSFSQLALLDDAAIDRLDTDLNLNGRIRRDDWVGQATKYAQNTGAQTWQK